MKIRLGLLEYDFRYTQYANTGGYDTNRKTYMANELQVSHTAADYGLTPTPVGPPRTIGKWTISNPLGLGAFGKVHCLTDQSGRIAVVKVIQGKRRNPDKARQEIQVLKDLTLLAKTADDHGGLVRLEEVIHLDDDVSDDANAPFKEIALILQPCVYGTFEKLTTARPSGRRYV
jgi:hypothetical protein